MTQYTLEQEAEINQFFEELDTICESARVMKLSFADAVKLYNSMPPVSPAFLKNSVETPETPEISEIPKFSEFQESDMENFVELVDMEDEYFVANIPGAKYEPLPEWIRDYKPSQTTETPENSYKPPDIIELELKNLPSCITGELIITKEDRERLARWRASAAFYEDDDDDRYDCTYDDSTDSESESESEEMTPKKSLPELRPQFTPFTPTNKEIEEHRARLKANKKKRKPRGITDEKFAKITNKIIVNFTGEKTKFSRQEILDIANGIKCKRWTNAATRLGCRGRAAKLIFDGNFDDEYVPVIVSAFSRVLENQLKMKLINKAKKGANSTYQLEEITEKSPKKK